MMRGLLIFLAILLFSFSCQAQVAGLSEADMKRAVLAEFAEQGIDGDVDIEFFGGQTSFKIENPENAKILISNLNAKEGQNKFTAEAEIFADGKQVAQTKLFGRYFVMAEVWLPVKDIAKDAVIKEADLYLGKTRAGRIKEDVIAAKDELLGKQVVRLIKADKPITKRDIRDEIIIKKGDMVTSVYTYKGLQITSKTEALENGSNGQQIKLLNPKSGKEIIGKVLDKNTVEIAAE